MSSVGGAPCVGSFCTKSVTGGEARHTSSDRRPSTEMAPGSTRVADARLGTGGAGGARLLGAGGRREQANASVRSVEGWRIQLVGAGGHVAGAATR